MSLTRKLVRTHNIVKVFSTSQSPTDSCRTHRIPEDSPGFLRIPQDWDRIPAKLEYITFLARGHVIQSAFFLKT